MIQIEKFARYLAAEVANFSIITLVRWAMEHKGKTTAPAAIAPPSAAPQALHHFALARVRELNLLAERTASPLKARAPHLPHFWLRLFSWRAH